MEMPRNEPPPAPRRAQGGQHHKENLTILSVELYIIVN